MPVVVFFLHVVSVLLFHVPLLHVHQMLSVWVVHVSVVYCLPYLLPQESRKRIVLVRVVNLYVNAVSFPFQLLVVAITVHTV